MGDKKSTDISNMPKSERDAYLFRLHVERLREEKGWTQNQLATELNKAGLSEFKQITVARLEKGTRTVKLGEAGVIAKVLGSTIDHMLTPPVLVEHLDFIQSVISEAYDAKQKLKSAIVNYAAAKDTYQRVSKDSISEDIMEQSDYLSEQILESYRRRLDFFAGDSFESLASLFEGAMRRVLGEYDTGLQSAQNFIEEIKSVDFDEVLSRAQQPYKLPNLPDRHEGES